MTVHVLTSVLTSTCTSIKVGDCSLFDQSILKIFEESCMFTKSHVHDLYTMYTLYIHCSNYLLHYLTMLKQVCFDVYMNYK